MDIKLRARLAAYSKMESIQVLNQPSSIPIEAIDKLFVPTGSEIVSKGDIDSLFENHEPDLIVSNEQIDSLFEVTSDVRKVTYAEIDKLFD